MDADSTPAAGGDTWTCATCGKQHSGMPFDWGFRMPDPWLAIPESDREATGRWTVDWCVMRGPLYLFRGVLQLPVNDVPGAQFGWGIWVSVPYEQYKTACDLWEQPGCEDQPPYSGVIQTHLSVYEDETLGLGVSVHPQPAGTRPKFVLLPSDHVLWQEQTQGITVAWVRQLNELMLHR